MLLEEDPEDDPEYDLEEEDPERRELERREARLPDNVDDREYDGRDE